jgi:hypothetical protein
LTLWKLRDYFSIPFTLSILILPAGSCRNDRRSSASVLSRSGVDECFPPCVATLPLDVILCERKSSVGMTDNQVRSYLHRSTVHIHVRHVHDRLSYTCCKLEKSWNEQTLVIVRKGFTWDVASGTEVFQRFALVCRTEHQSMIVSIGIEFFDMNNLEREMKLTSMDSHSPVLFSSKK